MCNLAIFMAFGATWVTIGGIIFYIFNKNSDEYILRESEKDGLL